MKREDALSLLHQYVKAPNMIKHSLAAEAVLSALAGQLGEDENKWGLAGLLHDLDIEITNADLTVHGKETEKILSDLNVDPEIIEAISLHNEQSAGKKRSARLHHALAAGETITGLIIATTLVYPDQKLSSVKAKSIKKRMKERAFAASVDRDIIRECEKCDLPLDEFIQICLKAMQSISDELDL